MPGDVPCRRFSRCFLERDVATIVLRTTHLMRLGRRSLLPCLAAMLERVCHPAFRAIPPTVPTNAVERLQAPSIAVAARRELGVMLVQCVVLHDLSLSPRLFSVRARSGEPQEPLGSHDKGFRRMDNRTDGGYRVTIFSRLLCCRCFLFGSLPFPVGLTPRGCLV